MAGNMKAKGKPCPKCGQLCVNGKSATIFDALYCLVAFVFVIVVYFSGTKNEWWFTHEVPIVIALIASMFVIPRIVHAFCFKLEQSIRLDAYK